MIIHDKQDTTTEIGRNYWLFIIQIWKFGQFEGGWGVRSWSSGIVDPHSLAELFIFFSPVQFTHKKLQGKNQIHAESQFWYVYKLQVSAWSFLPKLPWLHRDLLCSTVHCWEPGAQGPHCDAPIAGATHAETPFALQAQGLGEVASNPTERNIPPSN